MPEQVQRIVYPSFQSSSIVPEQRRTTRTETNTNVDIFETPFIRIFIYVYRMDNLSRVASHLVVFRLGVLCCCCAYHICRTKALCTADMPTAFSSLSPPSKLPPTLWYSLKTGSSSSSSLSSSFPSIDQVGGKGRNLLVCRQQEDFHVPEGCILTVSFFEPWVQHIQSTAAFVAAFGPPHTTTSSSTTTTTTDTTTATPTSVIAPPRREDCEAVQLQCATLTLNQEQAQALQEALTSSELTGTIWGAVRSSAPQEDSSQTSLAGVYHTTLGVRLDRPDKVLQALRASFASLFDYRVASVARASGRTTMDVRLAVVVQRQLDAEVSGIAFSLNPLNNCYDEAVINANRGLGETVVAGLVTPDSYKVDKVKQTILAKDISATKNIAYYLRKEAGASGGGVLEQAIEDPTIASLNDEQVLEVASLVTKVETFMGQPVDIEWAYDAGKLFLLQARPITTYVELYPEMITSPGATKQIYYDMIVGTQGFSDPLSVLGLDIWGEMFRVVKPHILPGPDGTIWELHGRQYLLLSNMLPTTAGESMVKATLGVQGGSSQRAFEALDLKEYTPAKVTEKNKNFFWGGMADMCATISSFARAWWAGENAWNVYLERANSIFQRFAPGGTEDTRGDITFRQAVDVAMADFQGLVPQFGGMLLAFYATWKLESLFKGDKESQDMLVALHMDLDGNPTSEMGHAMLRLASFPEIQETTNRGDFVQKLNDKEFSDEFLAVYKEFIDKFGCRAVQEIDVATPRSSDDPGALFDRIKQIDLDGNHILTVKKRKEDAYNCLLEKATQKRKDAHFKYYANLVQKLGGYREHPKFVFAFVLASLRRRVLKLADRFVAEGRLKSALSIFDLHIEEITKAESDPNFNLMECVDKNTAPYKKVAHVRDWPVMLDSRGKILRGPREDVKDGIGGDAISPGLATGRAKVLSSPYEKPLQVGEILVAKCTEPSWTPIFLNASGVVLEVGGTLQHGAIIAREYGIPCVSGIEQATTRISDGQLIEVDGTNGIVKILLEEKKKEEISIEQVAS